MLRPFNEDPIQYPLGPEGFAEKITVADAEAAAGFPIRLPQTAAASEATLTQAWVNRVHPEVGLVFDNGTVAITVARRSNQSALRYFHAFVAEKDKNAGLRAEIMEANGRPALVVWPRSNDSHSNPGVVSFWVHGLMINIYSQTYGTDALLAIAESMY